MSDIDYICSCLLCACYLCDCIITFFGRNNQNEYNQNGYNQIENVHPTITHQLSLFEIVTDFTKEKCLQDQNGISNCIICSDEIKKEQIIVECIKCKKYIGHEECIQKWIDIQKNKNAIVKCPHCMQS